MKGFEENDWDVISYSNNDRKYYIHKKFKFIKLTSTKRHRNTPYQDAVWIVKVTSWTAKPSSVYDFQLHCKRLTNKQIAQTFEKMMHITQNKHCIFDFLFEGQY